MADDKALITLYPVEFIMISIWMICFTIVSQFLIWGYLSNSSSVSDIQEDRVKKWAEIHADFAAMDEQVRENTLEIVRIVQEESNE